ncbi:MFS transporter [Herbidospora yilanensis]|uniref:MFS transporter n=1 Tax=Herbidospora yilanensis TaxID=354426 RepID=UPI000781BB14|nr:MFS transporter [Herbidospora yilanensis]
MANPAQGTRRITFYVALAVFAQESTWNFYDNRVPELLRDHIAGAAVIGLLMGMDNLLGIFIQPYMGNRSDNTRTAWGRRIPYLAVMMPLGAALFLLIPLVGSLGWLILVIFLYALVMNSFKPVSESLMPDFIGPDRRSRANAVVKIASALTTVVAALVSLLLVDDHPELAFAVPAGLMLVAAAVLVRGVRDNTSPAYQAALAEDATGPRPRDARITTRAVVADLVFAPDRRRLLLIAAVFVFGGAWFASRSLMTPYGVEVLRLSDGEAGGLTLPSGIVFILAAFPAALLAERFGRLRVMAGGITLFVAGLLLGAAVPVTAVTVVALCLGTAGAAAFIVNAVVVLWNLAPSSRVLGTYTGLYTVGWAGGGFAGPAVVGLAVDLTGWRLMLLHIAVLAAAAVVLVLRADRLEKAR